ncbi:unnamed protein product [Paramecium sonneborni]|uniref:Uncharacterized protein n=1 Tax=Paramecium sonneborni TaxID=65129 RepID=A0A8S1PIT7_9CILI|nr:unnamed protein product [Paramecium sonneborni]
MSHFYDYQSSTQIQIRQKIVLENLINQKYQPKSKQTFKNFILISQSKPQTYRDKINQSQDKISSPKLDQNIIKNSLLQDIGYIDLEIQKMTEEYRSSLNKTQLINSNNDFNYLQVVPTQYNQTDVSKSNHQISINKIQNSHNSQQTFSKLNQISEISYSKLAESIKSYSNQKKALEDKITNKPKIQPDNILQMKKQSNLAVQQTKTNEINNSQAKLKNPKLNTLISKINSERNKPTQIKPILKQTSFHPQNCCSIQINLNQNVIQINNSQTSKQFKNKKDEIIDDYQLDKAVKIFNSLKKLINLNTVPQQSVKKYKDNKNQIYQ